MDQWPPVQVSEQHADQLSALLRKGSSCCTENHWQWEVENLKQIHSPEFEKTWICCTLGEDQICNRAMIKGRPNRCNAKIWVTLLFVGPVEKPLSLSRNVVPVMPRLQRVALSEFVQIRCRLLHWRKVCLASHQHTYFWHLNTKGQEYKGRKVHTASADLMLVQNIIMEAFHSQSLQRSTTNIVISRTLHHRWSYT